MRDDSKQEEKQSEQTATLSSVFGEAVALLLASAKHRSLFLSDLEWVLMPALMLGQFRMFRQQDNNQPAGIALWAYLDKESEERLEETGKLRPGDWKSGDALWLVELISPMGGDSAMLNNLKKTALAGKAFSYHVTDAQGKRRVVRENTVLTNEETETRH